MATTASHNSLSEGSLQRRICLLNGSCQGPVDKGPGSQGSDWLSGSGHILCHPCFSWGQGHMLPHSLSLCIYPQKKRQISEHAGRHSISALWLTHSACLLSLVPHSDTLPNGCHKTCKRSWLSTLLQLNCVCARACMFLTLSVAHQATSLPNGCWEETKRRCHMWQCLSCLSVFVYLAVIFSPRKAILGCSVFMHI